MSKAATSGYCLYFKTTLNVQDDRRRGKNGKLGAVLGILVLAGVVGLTGCKSSSDPSMGQARKVVEASYQDFLRAGAKIIDFTKQNGEAKVVEGQKTYVYHFLVAFELPAGIGWQTNSIQDTVLGSSGGFVKDPGSAARAAMRDSPTTFNSIQPLPAGTTGVGKGTITFRATEQGWTDDMPDTRANGYCPPKTSPEVCYKKLGWDKLN